VQKNVLSFAHILHPPEQTIHVSEHQHLLSLMYVSSVDQLFYDIWQVQRGLKSIGNVCQQLHVVGGLQYFNVRPGIAEDRAQAFLKLIAFFGELQLQISQH